MDNKTTAMTGGQDTIVESEKIKQAVLGLGVEKEHLLEIIPLPKRHQDNVNALKKEIQYKGLSVVIAIRECVQTLKKSNLQKKGLKV